MLCSDGFRDYEPDYSPTLSAEKVEYHTEEGGRKRREAEEEEGRGKPLLILGTLPLFFIYLRSVPPHSMMSKHDECRGHCFLLIA